MAVAELLPLFVAVPLLTAGLSALIFAEPLTPLMVAGIAVIIAGVLCVELGSQRARARAVGAA